MGMCAATAFYRFKKWPKTRAKEPGRNCCAHPPQMAVKRGSLFSSDGAIQQSPTSQPTALAMLKVAVTPWKQHGLETWSIWICGGVLPAKPHKPLGLPWPAFLAFLEPSLGLRQKGFAFFTPALFPTHIQLTNEKAGVNKGSLL